MMFNVCQGGVCVVGLDCKANEQRRSQNNCQNDLGGKKRCFDLIFFFFFFWLVIIFAHINRRPNLAQSVQHPVDRVSFTTPARASVLECCGRSFQPENQSRSIEEGNTPLLCAAHPRKNVAQRLAVFESGAHVDSRPSVLFVGAVKTIQEMVGAQPYNRFGTQSPRCYLAQTRCPFPRASLEGASRAANCCLQRQCGKRF